MKTGDLQDLVERLRRFTGERRWSRFHDPKNLAMLVASEAGELLHLFRWVKSDGADAFAARPENREAIEEEIADVAIGVLLMADRVGVDLAEAVRSKIARNAEKYPPGRSLAHPVGKRAGQARGLAPATARLEARDRAGKPGGAFARPSAGDLRGILRRRGAAT